MPLLYYWRGDNYRRDLDMGAGYHLNQANPLMHQIDLGDSLWAFTRATDGRYVLAAELVIRAKTINRPSFRYGRYRVWGDLNTSRYFKVEGEPSIEQVIRALSCRANAAVLGRSFQGHAAVRLITTQDHQILREAARDLSLEPRARILPEEKLEAALLLGGRELVEPLILAESPGIGQARREYLYHQAPSRHRRFAQELQKLYQGKCQICIWNPIKVYGEPLCHGHHLHWLSRGGEDSIENMVLICPNHHGAIHSCDAPFDYQDYAFDFSDHREGLRLNLHL
ncbi:MAG: HNH endonuclease [Candidatus Poribacteria bacterium]|nr:HNH endonuclease [Candidatus Poribacteria bacterium]